MAPIITLLPPPSSRPCPLALTQAEDFAPSAFATIAVQRIALLDIRLFNMDRHAGNMLIQHRPDARSDEHGRVLHITGGTLQLVPIDHGFCLPERPTTACFEWRSWPQARAPLEPEALEYLRRIDAEADALLLRRAGLRAEAVRTMLVGSMLLLRGVRLGLSLAQIADVMCEPADEEDDDEDDEEAAAQQAENMALPSHDRSPMSVVETDWGLAPGLAPGGGGGGFESDGFSLKPHGGSASAGEPSHGREVCASLLQRMCERAEAEAEATMAVDGAPTAAAAAGDDAPFFTALAALIDAYAMQHAGGS